MWTETIRYASDLTNEGFALIEPLLPPARRLERPRQTSLREVLRASLSSLDWNHGLPPLECAPRLVGDPQDA